MIVATPAEEVVVVANVGVSIAGVRQSFVRLVWFHDVSGGSLVYLSVSAVRQPAMQFDITCQGFDNNRTW